MAGERYVVCIAGDEGLFDIVVGNQQKCPTFVKERSGGDGGVLGLPEQAVVAFALG
jgi:hypothetical protein